MQASKNGRIKVISNRFVLREGIDAPWLCHGIFATILGFGAYLQSGGRLMRPFAGKDFATIQDHGGNWHRNHVSLNADLDWHPEATEANMHQLLEERTRKANKAEKEGEEPPPKNKEPIRCPNCSKIMLTTKCVCGHTVSTKSRPVIGVDGALHEHTGDIVKQRRVSTKKEGPELWKQMIYRSRKAGRS